MTDTTTNENPTPPNWIARRFCHPLDRLWLGGVVAVNAVTWILFGAKYIGLALIVYTALFCISMRKRIKVAGETPEWRAAAEKKAHSIRKAEASLAKKKLFNIMYIRAHPFRAFIRYTFFVYLPIGLPLQWVLLSSPGWDELPFGAVSIGLTVLLCNALLIHQHRHLLSLSADGELLPLQKAAFRVLLFSTKSGNFSFWRTGCATIISVVCWCVLLYALIIGALGGDYIGDTHVSENLIDSLGAIIVLPTVSLTLLIYSVAVSRGWGVKP